MDTWSARDVVRSRCGGKGFGWRDGCVLDIALITSGEESREERAEVLYFSRVRKGGEWNNRDGCRRWGGGC